MTVETDTIVENEALDFLERACVLFGNVPFFEEEAKTMQCPWCSFEIPEMWKPLLAVHKPSGHPEKTPQAMLYYQLSDDAQLLVMLMWMKCPNGRCNQIIVQAQRSVMEKLPASPVGMSYKEPEVFEDETWFAVPRRKIPKPVDPLVPDDLRRDYIEAWLILDDSPRMSAVLSRRILTELLSRYANRTERRLTAQIQKFIDDPLQPTSIKENLDYLRAMGDFAAHALKDAEGVVVDVDYKDALWALEVIDSMFEYFIIRPAQDAERRKAFDEKMRSAGRSPLNQRDK